MSSNRLLIHRRSTMRIWWREIPSDHRYRRLYPYPDYEDRTKYKDCDLEDKLLAMYQDWAEEKFTNHMHDALPSAEREFSHNLGMRAHKERKTIGIDRQAIKTFDTLVLPAPLHTARPASHLHDAKQQKVWTSPNRTWNICARATVGGTFRRQRGYNQG